MLILPSASTILFQAVIPGSGASGARLDIAYLEFVNGPAIAPPDIDPTDIGYFDRLAATSDRDYLRCPVLSHALKNRNDKTVLSLSIVSDGECGFFGKPFSATAGSRIYGLTLAASRSNKQDDILFARHYYQPEEQPEKSEIGHIMISLDLVLP
jgi:hypothetical protein